jgi:hypothetical protein
MNLELAEHFPGLVMAVASHVLQEGHLACLVWKSWWRTETDARTFERMLSGFLAAIQKNQLQPGDELTRLLKNSE